MSLPTSGANRKERRRRVVFVLPSFDGGGSQRVLLTLLSHLDPAKYEAHLVLFSEDGPLRDRAPRNVEWTILGKLRLRQALPQLYFTLRRLRPDVIFSTFGYVNLGLLAMRPFLAGSPALIVREPNTPSTSLPQLKYGKIIGHGYSWLYRYAYRVVAQSEKMAKELIEQFNVPSELVVGLANPVDVNKIRDAAGQPRRAHGRSVQFVCCGRLTHQKGFDRLLMLFAESRINGHLTILGEGPEDAALRAKVERLGIFDQVTFRGFEPNPWRWFAGADALLLPSRWEGLSNAMLEALACGTPIIGTPEAGGIADVAAQTATGAVTIATFPESFQAAMKNVQPKHNLDLGPSLLPARYELSQVVAEFSRLLDAAAPDAPPQGDTLSQR